MNIKHIPEFSTILHLAEMYQEQYKEMGLCLSQVQNEAYFNDFVAQYYGAINNGKEPQPRINTDIPLF